MSASVLFDQNFYLTGNADIVLAISQGQFSSASDHFNQFGGKELRAPNATFNPSYYAINNPDVLNAVAAGTFTNVFAHYQEFGEVENRAPSTTFASFDAAGYLTANTDVAAAITAGTITSALDHYIAFGIAESRTGSGITSVEAVGSTISLTTSTDSITGTANADTLNGYINTTTATVGQSTLTGSDLVNGGDGTDTFSLIVEGANAAGSLTAAAFSGIENFTIRDINTSGASTYNFGTLTGETSVTSDRSSQDVTFSNVAAGTTVGMSGAGAGALTVTYTGAAATAAVINLSTGTSAGAVAVTNGTSATALTSLTLNSTGAANTVGGIASTDTGIITTTINAATNLTTTGLTVGTNASAQSLVVSGAATLVTLAALDVDFSTINASGMTAGGISGTMSTLVSATVTGGVGNDAITTNAVLTTGSVDAGDGTDTVTIAATAHLTATTGAKFTNFETLGVADGQTIDMDHIAGITGMVINDASTGATIANDVNTTAAGNIRFSDLEGAATIAVKGAATVGQIDTVGLTISDGDSTGSENLSIIVGVLTLANVETLTVNAVDDAEITQSAAASGALSTVTLTGSGNHSFVTGNMASINFNLDASASTSTNTLNAGTFATNGIAIKGGTGVDNITGSAQADSITGGAGNDVIINRVSLAATAAADTIAGGAGTDTFQLNGSAASGAVFTTTSNVSDFTVSTTATGGDLIQLSSVNAAYAAGLSEDGTAAGANGAVVLTSVAQSNGVTDANVTTGNDNFIKLSASVAFTTSHQGTFNAAIGTSTVTNLTAGTYAVSYHDATSSKMVILEAASANATLGTADIVRIIGSIDMSAADYANIDADNFANFA
jgi:hypothetical protein